MNIRICSKCGKIGLDQIDFRLFWHSQNNKFYYRPECITCQKHYDKKQKKEYYKNNVEHIKQYQKENIEHIKQYNIQWRKDNKGYFKQYRKDNVEHIKQYNNQWRKDNPDKTKQWWINRRALKANLQGNHTIDELKFIYKMQEGMCPSCNKHIPYEQMTVDHIIPISWEGSTDYASNIQLLCGSCNCSKKNFNNTDFRDIQCSLMK